MLSLIIAESALERIPAAITGHPSVTSTAKKFGKYPGRMMLDKSWHFGAMLSLNNKERRGRPDSASAVTTFNADATSFREDKYALACRTQ